MLKLRFDSFRSFIEEYSSRISEEGMFLATDDVQDVGSSVEFEISLSDDFRLLHGVGEVVWRVGPGLGSKHPVGMAVRFKDTDEPSRRLIARLVDNHRKAGGSPFVLGETPIEAFRSEPPPPAEAPEPPSLEPLEALDSVELDLGPPAAEAAGPAPPEVAEPSADVRAPDLDAAATSEPGLPPLAADAEASPRLGAGAGAPPPWPPDEPGEPAAPALPAEGEDLLSVPDIPELGVGEEPAAAPVEVSWSPPPAAPAAPEAPAAPPTDPEPPPAAPPPAAATRPPAAEPVIEALRPPGLEEPVEEPVYRERSSVQLAGAASARSRPAWVKPALIVAAVGAVAFGGAYFFADELKSVLGLGAESEVAEGPAAEPPPQTLPKPAPAEAAPESPDPEATPEAAAAEPPGAPAAPEKAAPPAPAPAVPPPAEAAPAPAAAAPTPAAPAGAALTGIDRITWETSPGETVLILWADGPIRPGAYELLRVENPPPREVIKLFAVSRPFPGGEKAVGTPEVLRVRSGLHERRGAQELHLVVDLADPAVRQAGIEAVGNTLRVRFARR